MSFKLQIVFPYIKGLFFSSIHDSLLPRLVHVRWIVYRLSGHVQDERITYTELDDSESDDSDSEQDENTGVFENEPDDEVDDGEDVLGVDDQIGVQRISMARMLSPTNTPNYVTIVE